MDSMEQIVNVLKDNSFFAELLNGPCRAKDAEKPYVPINPEWIDEELSGTVTDAYRAVMPPGLPSLTLVRAVKPEAGLIIDAAEKRMRYIIVTVLDEETLRYAENLPLILSSGIVSLFAWEMARCAVRASEERMRLQFSSARMPPFLNCATIEWVTLYTGRGKYYGPDNLRDMSEDHDEQLDLGLHLFNLHEMEDPLVKRLLEADESITRQPEEGNMTGKFVDGGEKEQE